MSESKKLFKVSAFSDGWFAVKLLVPFVEFENEDEYVVIKDFGRWTFSKIPLDTLRNAWMSRVKNHEEPFRSEEGNDVLALDFGIQFKNGKKTAFRRNRPSSDKSFVIATSTKRRMADGPKFLITSNGGPYAIGTEYGYPMQLDAGSTVLWSATIDRKWAAVFRNRTDGIMSVSKPLFDVSGMKEPSIRCYSPDGGKTAVFAVFDASEYHSHGWARPARFFDERGRRLSFRGNSEFFVIAESRQKDLKMTVAITWDSFKADLAKKIAVFGRDNHSIKNGRWSESELDAAEKSFSVVDSEFLKALVPASE